MKLETGHLRALNSMTKYPSIPTYHELDPRNGGLLSSTVPFAGPVIGTEKVDGTNARIITLPGGRWLLGSREELLLADGDLIGNPALGIVDAFRDLASTLEPCDTAIRVHYLELYGGKVGAAAKNYTGDPKLVGWRLFDVAEISNYQEVLGWTGEAISTWRENGERRHLTEDELQALAAKEELNVTPRLFRLEAADLPTDIQATRDFLAEWLPATRVALAESGLGVAEGIVLRTADRSVIAKARFQDYDRTLKRRR